jgi:hypothetical protein
MCWMKGRVLWLRWSSGREAVYTFGVFFCYRTVAWGSFVSAKHLGWCFFLAIEISEGMHFVVVLFLTRCTDTIPIDGFRARLE